MVVSKIFEDRLNLAHALIDRGEYDDAVDVLKNLKLRINSETVFKEVSDHMGVVDKTYEEKIKVEEEQHGDPWERELRARGFINDVTAWRAKELLRYMDKLSKEHDL